MFSSLFNYPISQKLPIPVSFFIILCNGTDSILTNEKYMGDALLQKTYTPNFLTHKSMVNNRTVRQYYVENSHPAIVDKETWKLVQKKITAEHKRKTGAQMARRTAK